MMYSKHQKKSEAYQKPCRVLMVEDNPDDRLLAKKNLGTSGDVGEVVCFHDGAALMGYIRRQEAGDAPLRSAPTVIVLDLNMPKMDGFEVLCQLKTEALLRDVPVIVVSGAPTFENVSRAFALKADAFFRKPLSACDLHVFLRHGWPWPPQL